MKNLINYIDNRSRLTPQLNDRIVKDFQCIEAKAGDILLHQDSIANKIYYIEKGIIHNYYYHKGKQITSWFYTEDHFVTAWYSFYNQKDSFEEMECLEDCTLYAISYDQYQRLISDCPNFGSFARMVAEEALSYLDYFTKSWSFLSAKEKYTLLEEHFPKIEQRVKLGQIASFLGISQETLSRIRGR